LPDGKREINTRTEKKAAELSFKLFARFQYAKSFSDLSKVVCFGADVPSLVTISILEMEVEIGWKLPT
jgi:hypothetical protein